MQTLEVQEEVLRVLQRELEVHDQLRVQGLPERK